MKKLLLILPLVFSLFGIAQAQSGPVPVSATIRPQCFNNEGAMTLEYYEVRYKLQDRERPGMFFAGLVSPNLVPYVDDRMRGRLHDISAAMINNSSAWALEGEIWQSMADKALMPPFRIDRTVIADEVVFKIRPFMDLTGFGLYVGHGIYTEEMEEKTQELRASIERSNARVDEWAQKYGSMQVAPEYAAGRTQVGGRQMSAEATAETRRKLQEAKEMKGDQDNEERDEFLRQIREKSGETERSWILERNAQTARSRSATYDSMSASKAAPAANSQRNDNMVASSHEEKIEDMTRRRADFEKRQAAMKPKKITPDQQRKMEETRILHWVTADMTDHKKMVKVAELPNEMCACSWDGRAPVSIWCGQ